MHKTITTCHSFDWAECFFPFVPDFASGASGGGRGTKGNDYKACIVDGQVYVADDTWRMESSRMIKQVVWCAIDIKGQ